MFYQYILYFKKKKKKKKTVCYKKIYHLWMYKMNQNYLLKNQNSEILFNKLYF